MAGFFKRLFQRFTRPSVDWDELEETLIEGDIGIRTTMQIVDELKSKGKHSPEQIVEVTRRHLLSIFPPVIPPLPPFKGRPKVILVVGVNGTGKTTSTAKLARLFQRQGQSVMLAAADTFRAAAIEQLDSWAQRLNVPILKGQYKSDPSSVCFDACDAAEKKGIDNLICDTAGRLHTRHNLMEELKKIQRVLGRKDPTSPHEILLVVDATTGSNAMVQAREFQKAMPLTGLILTKLDGSGKGGVAIAIGRELNIWPRYVGTGEGPNDFSVFDPVKYVDELM